jgi:hypothetical protein
MGSCRVFENMGVAPVHLASLGFGHVARYVKAICVQQSAVVKGRHCPIDVIHFH